MQQPIYEEDTTRSLLKEKPMAPCKSEVDGNEIRPNWAVSREIWPSAEETLDKSQDGRVGCVTPLGYYWCTPAWIPPGLVMRSCEIMR